MDKFEFFQVFIFQYLRYGRAAEISSKINYFDAHLAFFFLCFFLFFFFLRVCRSAFEGDLLWLG